MGEFSERPVKAPSSFLIRRSIANLVDRLSLCGRYARDHPFDTQDKPSMANRATRVRRSVYRYRRSFAPDYLTILWPEMLDPITGKRVKACQRKPLEEALFVNRSVLISTALKGHYSAHNPIVQALPKSGLKHSKPGDSGP